MVSLHLFGDYFTSQSLGSRHGSRCLNSGREPFLFSIYFGVPLLARGAVRSGRRWPFPVDAVLDRRRRGQPVERIRRSYARLPVSPRPPAAAAVPQVSGKVPGHLVDRRRRWRRGRMGGDGSTAPGRRFTRARSVAIALPLTIGAVGWMAAGACMYLPTASGLQILRAGAVTARADPVEAAVYMLRTLPRAASFACCCCRWRPPSSSLRAREPEAGGAGADRAVRADRRRSPRSTRGASIRRSTAAHLAEPAWLSLTHADPDSRFYVGGKTDGTLDASDLDSSGAYLNPPGLSGSASRAALSGQANFYPSGWRQPRDAQLRPARCSGHASSRP